MRACRNTIACMFLLLSGLRAEMPTLFKKPEFNSETLAKAANHYIRLGEAEAIKELKALAAADSRKRMTGDILNSGFQMDERLGWICRIVFEPKGMEPLRSPRLGALSLPDRSISLEKWPRYPLAQAQGVYFVLAEGYLLAGVAEDMGSYIDYCRNNGKFRNDPVAVPTSKQALDACEVLRNSPPWRAIKWKDSGADPNQDAVLAFMRQQATWK